MAEADENKVILHQIYRISPRVPNISPPCLKLETFLRMAKIPYKVESRFKRSSKGKMPWIEDKGKEIADSGFCIEYLSKEYGVDLDSHLTPEQKAIATAFRVMLEENTYWTIAYYRWCSPEYADKWRSNLLGSIPTPLRHLIFWHSQRNIKNQLWAHGIGRHSKSEIYSIAERDLRAVSVFLGDKKFMFGDNPCLTDAAVFAHVASFIWGMSGSPQEKLINEELKNLKSHAERMLEMYFPDIDELYRNEPNSVGAQEWK